MKYGHIIIMAMLIGTACSHDSSESRPADVEVPVVETRTAITFSGMQEEGRMVDQGTRANRRAGTPLSASAHRFKVWGDKNMTEDAGVFDKDGTTMQTVFPGYIVNWLSGSSSASNSNGWEYVAQQDGGYEQTIKYWDWSAKAYRYFAVTGNPTPNANATYEENEVSYKAYEFTMTADCSTDEKASATPFYSHLWFSTGQLPTYTDKQFGKAVQLEFLKPFARVRFMFNYAYAAEAVKVTNPSFKPSDGTTKIARKGTFTVTYPLTGTATSEWYAATKNNAPAEGEELEAFTEEYIPEGTEKWYLVLPVDTQDSYTMTVTVNNVEKTAEVPGEYMTWKPGYSYTYIFKITDDGGVAIDLVQTAVTPWTNMETTHTVYNW